ncbi:phage tail protein [Paenibacillus aceti]|uniref:Tail fiber protein n=1 Tax=Paenibacillus aceti TaxID=1820010 RepID=A0ABQ1W3R0_9BACL|nr:phage tail protein [Paenibacillus aceti]GGG13585.1 hypothetical protein GCM10010913_39230 [Paenibacillus aceti]
MAKTNWKLTDTVKPEDMNSLGQEINNLQQNTKPASLTKPGIVQLFSATNSTAEDRAATPKAVKTAEDNAKAYTDGKLDRVDLTTTLGPGTSVIDVDQASGAEFRVYGNTLVNLLGSYGNFEVPNGDSGVAIWWSGLASGKYSITSENVKYGLKAQRINALVTDSNPQRGVASAYKGTHAEPIKLTANKWYVFIADYTNIATGNARLSFFDRAASQQLVASGNTTTGSGVAYVKLATTKDYDNIGLYLYNQEPVGGTGAVIWDGAGLYEVSEELYNRIGVDITAANIRDYLPHVDGVQHADGVVVSHPSKNLLPSQPDALNSRATLTAPYEMTLNATGPNQHTHMYVPTVKGQKYTFNIEATGFTSITGQDKNGANLVALKYSDHPVPHTFTVPEGVVQLMVSLTTKAAGTFTYKNWKLELGDKATPFEPAKPQQLIISEKLAEVEGVRDEVRVGLQGATLVKRVERGFALDGSLPWNYGADSTDAFALLLTDVYSNPPWQARKSRGIRYDGKVLGNVGVVKTRPDQMEISTRAYVTVDRSIAGWTTALQPNAIALKALMNGWKANGNNGSIYNSWVSILDGKAPATNTGDYVSKNKAPGWTAWATIDYALGVPEIKQIKTEGGILLHPGGNQLTVETGIIQREKACLHYSPNEKAYYINGTDTTKLSRRVSKILAVYKGADFDNDSWQILTRAPSHASWWELGADNAKSINEAAIEPNADYYVTYSTLDKYNYLANVTLLDVSYKAGISATLSDVVSSSDELKAQNDRQDFADMYIQAYTENNRKDLDSHASATTGVHGATYAPIPDSLMSRSANGRTQVADPVYGSDASTKAYVDNTLKSHTDSTAVHGATNAATASRIMMRDSAGRAKVAAPNAADDIAIKGTVDDHANLTTAHGATSAVTANRLVLRDSTGRAQVAAPAASADIARLDTVNNAVGNLANLKTTDKSNTVAALNELFINVSNGKSLVAAAITDQGVSASGSDTFPQLASKIALIKTGKEFATGTLAVASSDSKYFFHKDDTLGGGPSIYAYGKEATGLYFQPSIIVMFADVSGNSYVSVYRRDMRLLASRGLDILSLTITNTGNVSGKAIVDWDPAFVGARNFLLPVMSPGTYTWLAYQ